jgi:hypothetical protein
VPKTGPHLQWITKTVLGCQKTNGINPRSAIRQQQHFHRPYTVFVTDGHVIEFKTCPSIYLPYFPAYKTPRPIRRTLIFSFGILEKIIMNIF